MIKKNITIFCQASGDITHTLALYERSKHVANISIFCVNTPSIYEYILSLNLNLKSLNLIPYDIDFSIKNPISIILARKKLKKKYKNLFIDYYNIDIYFFSIWFDWITFSLLNKLSKNNNIFYYEHYKNISEVNEVKYNLKEKYILIIYRFITGVPLEYLKENKSKRLLFLYKKINIKKQVALEILPELFNSYLYKIENISIKSILLFETQVTTSKIFSDYHNEMEIIIKALQKKGYELFIKGHPRLGVTKGIESLCNFSIPKNIPSEFIDTTKFKKIIGIESFSLVYHANFSDLVFSIIELLSFHNLDDKIKFINYLNINSNNKINFPKNISELCLLKD